jgi:large subunit ribosomal protein L35
MPKLKTRKGVAKRFRITKSGRIKKRSANRGHLLSKRSTKRKRRLRKGGYVSATQERMIRRLLPYG